MANKNEILRQIEDYLKDPNNKPENRDNQSLSELVHEFNNLYTELFYQNQELQAAQEALELANQRLLDVFHNTPVGLAVVDNDFIIKLVNNKLQSLVHHHPACVEHADIRTMIHPDDQNAFHLFFNRLKNEENELSDPLRIKTTEDRICWFKIRGKLFADSSRLPQKLLAFEDVTEAVEAKLALREKSHFFEVIMKNVVDIVALADLDVKLRWVSPSIRLLGYEPEELIGQHVLQLVAEPFRDTVAEAINMALLSKQSGKIEYQAKKKDGSYEWVETLGNFSIGSNGDISDVIFVTRIITERKMQEEATKNYAELLAASNATKDKLFSIIAHDLRSPFMSLLGISEIIADPSFDLGYNELRELGKTMHKTSKATFDLLEDLLEWSRVQRGVIKPKNESIDIDLMLHNLHDLFAESLRGKNIRMHIKNPDKPGLITDRGLLLSVLRNLVSNAIKFSEPDSSIELKVSSNKNGVLFSIADHGIGIPPDIIPKLFAIDDSKKRAGTAGERSTGLGLVVANDLVSLLNGKIWAQPNGDRGTVFFIELPVVEE